MTNGATPLPELTPDEVNATRARLNQPEWRARLDRLQQQICAQFSDFRSQSETMTIRAIVPRPQIKELDSVVKKINRERRSGHAFEFDDIEDFIGIKVLCPYPSDVRSVINWMRTYAGFVVQPATDNQARRLRPSGYRGYHYTVRISGHLAAGNEDLLALRCEVQIKTMLEEAWDAKTHDTQYRREHEIDTHLISQMKLLSDALAVLDEQSEIVKQQIQETELEESRRKTAVLEVYMRDTRPLLEELVQAGRVSAAVLDAAISSADDRIPGTRRTAGSPRSRPRSVGHDHEARGTLDALQSPADDAAPAPGRASLSPFERPRRQVSCM